MHYKVLFRIEKYPLMEKLIHKIGNYKRYCDEVGDTFEIEVVFAGDVVKHFANLKEGLVTELVGTDLDLALCHNALSGCGMEDINEFNVRTVRAGIGEIITKKAQGYIEYTIE